MRRSRARDDASLRERGVAACEDAQVHMALEAVGAPTFLSAVRSLRPGGRLVLVGNVTAGQLNMPMGLAILNSLEIIGSDRLCATRARARAPPPARRS